MTTNAEFTGTLSESPLTDVLSTLEETDSTGVLNLAGGGEIWIHQGQTYLASSPAAPALSSVLFAADVGSLEDLEALLSPEQSDVTALDKLCIENPESVVTLQRLVQEHNLNGLFEMMVPSDQQFSFRAGVSHPIGSRFAEQTSTLIEKASTRVETWRKIATRIPSTNALFTLAHSLPRKSKERVFTADEWRFVSYLDGQTSVASVITQTEESAFRVTSALYRLLLEGLIEEKST